MHIAVLGPLEVRHAGVTVSLGGARVRALLIRLALDAGRPVTVEALASALWPQAGPARPANAVQTLVSRLRAALPEPEVVRSEPGGYRLDLAPEAVDATRFEQLARDGRQALTGGDHAAAAKTLREALALWRGEALADVAEAPYAAAAATRLTELQLAATEDRIAADLMTTPPGPLIAEARALVTAYPLRERVRGLLVRALHADGRPGEALAAYEDFRRLLADELGADPSPELQARHRAVLRGEAGDDRTPRGNLRAELTSFVGRDRERQHLRAELAQRRLVTLVGPGGAGKTRLATTVAAELAPYTAGGAWLAELASVVDPGEVGQAVVAALGLRETGVPHGRDATGDGPLTRLVDALAATETLLVLDNCEHQLAAVAPLVDTLLASCPRLRILATSREPLGIGGEALSPVPPLDLPGPEATFAQAATYPAVRLFAERAAAARAGFTVTGDNLATVVEICRRLDGLPLAIELAAARLRSLTLDQVACRLDDRFRLLTGGSRTALPRHQTLHAVVAWSWELLDTTERQVAQRLSVFPGLIVPEGAERVCQASVEALAALVDRSLLQLQDGPDGPRYRMLETIRDFGRERLTEAGELDQTRRAHAAYYLDLAERAAPQLRGAGQLAWIERLRAEDGSSTTFRFARATGNADMLVRLAAALSHLWTLQGDHAVAARRLGIALAAPGPAPPEARAQVSAAYLFNTMLAGGDAGEAVSAVPRPSGLAAGHPATAMTEALLAMAGHDIAGGLAATEPHLRDPDPWTRGLLWLLRSWLHGNDGAVAAQRRDLDAAVAAFRAAGERWGLATSLIHRAHVQTTLGDLDGAIAGLTEALASQCALGVTDGGALPRVLIAAARVQQGDRIAARAELQQLVTPEVGPPSSRTAVMARLSLGDLARLDGDPAEAARQYDAAERSLDQAPSGGSLLRAMLGCGRGHLAIADARPVQAAENLAGALDRALRAPDMPIVADVAVAAARLRWLTGARRPDRQDPLGRWHGGSAATAAEVLGAAHALRGAADARDPDVAALAEGLQGELGEHAYHAAYERGHGLERADALALITLAVRCD